MTFSPLRIAFFGTDGPLSRGALRALARDHRIVAVIQPEAPRPGSLRAALARMARRSLAGLAGAAGAPLWTARGGDDADVERRLAAAGADLVCIAGYPWLIPESWYVRAPLGGVNVHAALLPRHRGVLPLFWIYHRDDRMTGVTVHQVNAKADAGDILDQDSYPLARGFPVEDLNRLNAVRGAALMQKTVRAMARGALSPRAQEDRLATAAPRIRDGASMVDFGAWPSERVWHFLAGLFPRFREPLPVRYDGVLGYVEAEQSGAPGSVSRHGSEGRLHCLDGFVRLRVGGP